MSLVVEVGPLVDPGVARCLDPVFGLLSAREDLPEGGMVVVGAPSAAGLARARAARVVVVVPAYAADDDPFYRTICERAGEVTELELPAPTVALAARGIEATTLADARVTDVQALLSETDAHAAESQCPVRLVAGRPEAVVHAREAWAAGAAVVAMSGPAAESLRRSGGALVADTVLEAVEAVALLGRTPRLAMTLARRGRDLLGALPSAEGVAAELVAALRRADGTSHPAG